MRKLIGLGLATALATALFAVPASAQTVTKFSVLGRQVSSHRVSSDTFAFRDRLLEPGNRSNVLGHDKGRCTLISRAAAHCRVVFSFANGKVKVNGTDRFRQHLSKVPVVGGTRAYNGVSGKSIVHHANHRDTLVDFTLVR